MAENNSTKQQSFLGLSEENNAERGKNMCVLCNSKFKTIKEMHKHYTETHEDIQMKHKTYVFHSDEELGKWKREEEIKSKASFVKRGGSCKINNKQTNYYICNRSGVANIKTDRKRHMKILGSVKCGMTCPAFMKTTREQNETIKITVEYQSTHVGHEKEIGKLRMHNEDRKNIASLLKSGVPPTKIIEDMKKTYPPSARLGLTTKKDIHNISYSFKLYEAVLHNDALSIGLQGKEMQKEVILNEKEKPAACDTITEKRQRIQDQIQTLMSYINMAQTDEELENLEKHLAICVHSVAASNNTLCLPTGGGFPTNKYTTAQKQKIKKTKPSKKLKLVDDMQVKFVAKPSKKQKLVGDMQVKCTSKHPNKQKLVGDMQNSKISKINLMENRIPFKKDANTINEHKGRMSHSEKEAHIIIVQRKRNEKRELLQERCPHNVQL